MRENNAYANKTWKYYYDNSGNITMRDEYAYTTGTLPSSCSNVKWYSYSTGAWGDLLTNYNGTSITYDAIGNPTNWRNATSLTWGGRKLTRQDISSTSSVTYGYNADGIRVSRSYNSSSERLSRSHQYVLDGTNVIYEKQQTVAQFGGETNELYYHYDESGVAGFELNGTNYYFLKNIQGDVINILNSSGQVVVTYTYDAWGKVLSVTGSLASTVGQINPFRYRGYYYDSETGFYYLQTRYYDPEVGRFLNADDASLIGANGGIQGYNLFAYCNNNPVMHSDPTGYIIKISDDATDDDIYQYENARKYLCRSLRGNILFFVISRLPIELNLVFIHDGEHDRENSYEPETRTIYWDPYCGHVLGNETSVQSPAVGLFHEMGHAMQHLQGKFNGFDYSNEEDRLRLENDNLNRFEGPICEELGEPIRGTYKNSSGKRVMDSSTHYRKSYKKYNPGWWPWQWFRYETIIEDHYGR